LSVSAKTELKHFSLFDFEKKSALYFSQNEDSAIYYFEGNESFSRCHISLEPFSQISTKIALFSFHE